MKVAIVTGASSGIGYALSRRLGRSGYAVVAVARRKDALDTLAAEIAADGSPALVLALDLTQPHVATAIVRETLATFGQIDVLINNAGFASTGDLAAQSDEALRAQFLTHVEAPVALIREARAALAAQRGIAFNVGSGVARVPIGGMGAYAPAKAALRSATAILRRELRGEGIAVTYVDPGAVDTAFMTRAGMRGGPPSLLVSPHEVARKITNAILTRPREVNAVPWQTAGVVLASLFPRLTDALLSRVPDLVGATPPSTELPSQAEPQALEPATPSSQALPSVATDDTLAGVLEPLARRMEKLGLREAFVRGLLVPGAELNVGDVALQWAGMPNKNERKLTVELLELLTTAAYLESIGEDRWIVRRAPSP